MLSQSPSLIKEPRFRMPPTLPDGGVNLSLAGKSSDEGLNINARTSLKNVRDKFPIPPGYAVAPGAKRRVGDVLACRLDTGWRQGGDRFRSVVVGCGGLWSVVVRFETKPPS